MYGGMLMLAKSGVCVVALGSVIMLTRSTGIWIILVCVGRWMQAVKMVLGCGLTAICPVMSHFIADAASSLLGARPTFRTLAGLASGPCIFPLHAFGLHHNGVSNNVTSDGVGLVKPGICGGVV